LTCVAAPPLHIPAAPLAWVQRVPAAAAVKMQFLPSMPPPHLEATEHSRLAALTLAKAQLSAAVAIHTPFWQRSVPLHRLPSSQIPPFFGCVVQTLLTQTACKQGLVGAVQPLSAMHAAPAIHWKLRKLQIGRAAGQGTGVLEPQKTCELPEQNITSPGVQDGPVQMPPSQLPELPLKVQASPSLMFPKSQPVGVQIGPKQGEGPLGSGGHVTGAAGVPLLQAVN